MRPAGNLPQRNLLHADSVRAQDRDHELHGRNLYGRPDFGPTQDIGRTVESPRNQGGKGTHPHPDAEDATSPDLSGPPHDRAQRPAQEIPLPAAGREGDAREPGVEYGRHLH